MSLTSYHALTQPPTAGAPLIFAFHGTGGKERQFFELAGRLVPGAGVVAPRGNVSEQGVMRFFRRTGDGVYDMDDLATQTQTMASYVAAHCAAYPRAPVFGFGYSNGANILASVAMAHPHLFDRIGLLHPLIPWQLQPVADLADRHVLITAGRHDPICPWPLTARLINWFRAQGSSVSTSIHDGGHDLRQPELSALRHLLTTSHNFQGDHKCPSLTS